MSSSQAFMARATQIMSGVDLARDGFPCDNDMKEARYFLSKTYNTITVEIKVIRKIYFMTFVAYGLSFTEVINHTV
jgi:hypothetical protein